MSATPSARMSAVATAMVCCALVTAQFVGGKAARDALYLAQFDVTSLPTMVIVTSILSIALVTANSRTLTSFSPARIVPATFALSAALLLVEWMLTTAAPRAAAVLVYLHIAGFGPVLGSGFWLIASERFDPRTAKWRYGEIAGAGTLGGLAGGLLAERLGVWFGVIAVLPFLAALNVLGALGVRYLATASLSGVPPASSHVPPEPAFEKSTSGLRLLIDVPYIRNLAALVLLGTTSATLIDYVFKAEAVGAFGRGEGLLRFFAIYYTATSVLTFVVQTAASQFLLQRFGLAFATSLPASAVLAGSVVSLLAPGFTSVAGARSGESIFRGSLFRFGYELFYTPIPAKEKRAVKSFIDVGVDRLGDAVGAGLIAVVLAVAPGGQYPAILYLGIAVSGAAVVLASRLNRGYIHTLENSLRNRAVHLDLADVQDRTTRTTILRTLGDIRTGTWHAGTASSPSLSPSVQGIDPEVRDIIALRSRDRASIAEILRRDKGPSAVLVPHIIPLLAWTAVAADAASALRKVAEEHIGELSDALINPRQDFAVRRRLARVFAVCVSQRAVDALMRGLEDSRFEVRFQCGRSLSAVQQTNPLIRIERDAVLEVILREMAVSRSVWESRRLLDELESQDGVSPVDDFVRDRAGQSLAHVFTLLSLVLPREPLRIAFLGLHSGDQQLQGTALEYLEGVLPAPVRDRLWPFLEDRRPAGRVTRPREEILSDLLRSNQSIMVNIEELKRRYTKA
jgi:ATP:ADP antiporter, AAA family